MQFVVVGWDGREENAFIEREEEERRERKDSIKNEEREREKQEGIDTVRGKKKADLMSLSVTPSEASLWEYPNFDLGGLFQIVSTGRDLNPRQNDGGVDRRTEQNSKIF